ncbi:hypothetical protein FQR65_LT19707 [Abscondita terminalis]|nr:hypothetical protein FQR65_LT19707 [Abscondita terminalis]
MATGTAHQKEILDQAINTYRNILEDKDFGQTMYEGKTFDKPPKSLFATVQTLSIQLDNFNNDHFDLIVFDEAHHIAANTFDTIFNYFKPKQVIGLTATPEREDGKEIKTYFDNEFASELRV